LKASTDNIIVQKGEVQSNGQTLYWESYGEGKPFVLVMGIGYDSTLWGLHQVPFFSEHFKTIIFDNRDVGRSSKATKAYTITDMADDVAGLMDGLGIERTHMLGLSMGAMIAQEFAIRYPGKLEKLVLTGTGAATARSKFDPISIWSYVKTQDTNGLMFAAEQFIWLFSESFNRNHEAVDQTLQMLASNPNPVTPEAYQRQAEAYIKHDTLDRLNQVTAPTIVIAGEQDRLTPPWICREVADAIPNAKYKLIMGAGSSHVLPLERPDDFNQAVLSFLQQ
jgi:pimeloyl-ACP methyl ester carboxylesterase